MAYKIIWTENAREDLKEIVNYLQEEWSHHIAEEFIVELYLKLELIRKYPNTGKASQNIQSIRRILITKHNALYYMVNETELILLDFFDTRQNPEKNLFE